MKNKKANGIPKLSAIAKLAIANEKIANTIPMTIASSKTGESALGAAANLNTKIGDAFIFENQGYAVALERI